MIVCEKKGKMMMLKYFVYLQVLLLTVAASVCFAQEQHDFGISARLSVLNMGTEKIGDVDADFDMVLVPGLALHYFITQGFSLSLGLDTFQTNVDVKHDSNSGRLGKFSQTPVLLTMSYQRQINKTDASIYLGAGAGYFFNSFENNGSKDIDEFFGLNMSVKTNDSVGIHFNTGALYPVSDRYSITFDYTFITNKARFHLTYPNAETRNRDVALNNSLFRLGVIYHF
jgi:outer membrane protein W